MLQNRCIETIYLHTALEVREICAVFQCRESGPVSKAFSELVPRPERVHLLTQVVSHDWLFPQCHAVLHHGGSGTVAAALLAGRPQIISPVMFDQTMWAEHLGWMGVAYQCPSPGKMKLQNISQGLEYVAGETVQKSVTDLSNILQNENGVKFAVDMIHKTLDKFKR